MMDDNQLLKFCRESMKFSEIEKLIDGWPRRLDVASNATLEKVQAAMPGWTVRPAPPRNKWERKHWPGVFLVWPPWAPPVATP
jgi:hypothetical protein